MTLVKRNWKFRPKARLRVGVMPLAAKGAVRWKNLKVRSGRAYQVKDQTQGRNLK